MIRKIGAHTINRFLVKHSNFFPSEVKLVKREDLRDDEGRQVSHRHFFAGVKRLQQMLCSRRWGQVRHSNHYYQSKVGSRFWRLLLNILSLSNQSAMFTLYKDQFSGDSCVQKDAVRIFC